MSERIQNVIPKEYNGTTYRSTLEAQTAKTLDEMGIPFAYEERKIELLQGFHSPFQKDKVRAVTYTPDFIVGPIMLECKGFETPEWKLKKKLVFKWLQENEPSTIFHQIHDARKSLLMVLDLHWQYLGYYIEVSPQPSKSKKIRKEKMIQAPRKYDSIAQAMNELNLKGKNIGPILNSLTGKKPFIYGYCWRLIKISL